MASDVYLGVDVGTQGVRAAAMESGGELISQRSVPFSLNGNRQEQSPTVWWESMIACLQSLHADLRSAAASGRIRSLAVTSTSGTVLPLDKAEQPLHSAFMYSDPRSAAEARLCREASRRSDGRCIPFNPSYGLPKMIWYVRKFPDQAEQIGRWCHASDYLIGRLSGVWGVTDYTNALKSGYDLEREAWPDFISDKLGLPNGWLPAVVKPGTRLGSITSEVAELTGLPEHVQVVVGMTDGCCSQIASGANEPGDWNTTIGTTLVIKGVTDRPVPDPLGRVYNHKHPEGLWMPGGASNTGADWISQEYATDELDSLNRQAASLFPTPWVAYPLLQEGERFPFVAPGARGFSPPGLTREQLYAAKLEGVAMVERFCYELMEQLCGEPVRQVFTAGGGSNNPVWLQVRSNMMNKPVVKMKHTFGVIGAAIVAASSDFAGLREAARFMTCPELRIEPVHSIAYEEKYARFVEELKVRMYIPR